MTWPTVGVYGIAFCVTVFVYCIVQIATIGNEKDEGEETDHDERMV